MTHYKAVLFDFDYTLGDCTDAIVGGFRYMFREMGWPEPSYDAVKLTIGQTLQNAYTGLTGDRDEAHREQLLQGFRRTANPRMVTDAVFLPGAMDLLQALWDSGVPYGIVSTKQTKLVEDIFAHRGLLEKLSVIVGGDRPKANKPAPDSLFLALQELGLPADEVLYCGDTVIDAECASRAGVDFCAVLNGTTPREAFADWPTACIAQDLFELRHFLTL